MNNMEKMLQTASRKLKISPNELKELLSKGDMNAIMSKMDKSESQKLKKALDDPNVVSNLKNSPEMTEYMKKNTQNAQKKE